MERSEVLAVQAVCVFSWLDREVKARKIVIRKNVRAAMFTASTYEAGMHGKSFALLFHCCQLNMH